MEKSELERKKDAFFALLAREGLDSYWIVKAENVRYLTGFHGEDSTLLAAGGKYCLVTDRRYSEEAGNTAFIDDMEVRDGPMAQAAGRLCLRLGTRKLGITARNITCADYKAVSDAGGMEVSMRREGPTEEMRLCKSAPEIEHIKECVRIAEKGFRRFLNKIEVGRTEKWLAGRLEWDLRQSGAEKAAFETICAVAEHGSRPHSRPADRPLRTGETLLVDWGARAWGYNSDLTRVVAMSTIPSKTEDLAQVVLEAQEAAFGILGPGLKASEVDSAARQVIGNAGYGAFFSHGLGHGVGLEVHEPPVLAPGQDICLKPGMVVTIEPAIYIPGRYGVRIEEMAFITDSGHERLSGLERSPICI